MKRFSIERHSGDEIVSTASAKSAIFPLNHRQAETGLPSVFSKESSNEAVTVVERIATQLMMTRIANTEAHSEECQSYESV